MGETDSRERIMAATYRALGSVGFADLTMSDIAEESGTSTALLHYHFDTKEDLLVAFLTHLTEEIEADLQAVADADPVTRLHTIVEWYVLDESNDERESFHRALLELRSQAGYNDRYRDRLQRADQLIREWIAEIIVEGIEEDLFTDADPPELAAFILAALDGARTRQLTVGDPSYSARVKAELYVHVFADLFTGEAADRWLALTDEERA